MKLINSGDYSSGAEHMEDALRLYLHEHDLCQADCEGISQLSPHTDFYTVIAGEYAVFKMTKASEDTKESKEN